VPQKKQEAGPDCVLGEVPRKKEVLGDVPRKKESSG